MVPFKRRCDILEVAVGAGSSLILVGKRRRDIFGGVEVGREVSLGGSRMNLANPACLVDIGERADHWLLLGIVLPIVHGAG